MLFSKKAILLVLALFACGLALHAQVVSPAMIFSGKNELAAKGITEDQLKAKLAEKGVNVANVKPEDLPGLKSTIEEAVKELEAENAAKPAGALKDTKLTGDKDAGVTKSKEVNALDTKKESKDSTQNAKDAKKESIKPEKDSTAIYGHSLFTDKTLDFYRTLQTASTPDYYVLDAGDKISINIFGISQDDLIYQIEEDGFIRPKGMYKIYLKGLPLAKARELLFKRFQQSYVFNKGQFNLEVTTARTITVNIFGAVQHPGSYTISSLNNALHAILAAGGPTKMALCVLLEYLMVTKNIP